MQKPIDAPEYVSYGEWSSRQKKFRYRRTLVGASVGLAILLAVLFGIYHDRLSLVREQRALISSIDHLENYEVHTLALGPNGRTSQALRDESHQGQDWELSLWGGQVIFSKRGPAFFTYEAGSNTLFQQGSWFGAADCMSRLRAALVASDPWRKGARQFVELSQAGQFRRYQVLSDNERYEIEVDANFRPISVTLFRNTVEGWRPTETSHLNFSAKYIGYPADAKTRRLQLFSNGVWDALYTTVINQVDLKSGFIMYIRGAQANPAGTVFLYADGLTPPASISATSSDGTPYLASLMRIDPPDFNKEEPYNVIVATRLDHKPVKWPLHLKFAIGDSQKKTVATFSETINRPECDPIPYWFCNASASDRPFFDYYRKLEKLLGDYYSTLFYSKGKPVNIDSPNLQTGYSWNPIDRSKGLKHELASLDYYYQSAPAPNDPADDPYLAESWFSVYKDGIAIANTPGGEPRQDSLRALRLASDALHRHDYRGPVSEKIAAALVIENANALGHY